MIDNSIRPLPPVERIDDGASNVNAQLCLSVAELCTSDMILGHEVACASCSGPLGQSPSDRFCSEQCQADWYANQAECDWPAGTVTPAVGVPDAPPVRPMTWLDPNSPRRPPLAGHAVLDEVTAFVRRFSAFPSDHCAPTLALWFAHTHIADRLYVTPRLILDSAEPGSGKTRVLEVAQYLVAAPEMTVSASRAALFRLVAEGPITVLFDEVDTIFSKAGGGNEDLRAMLNAGYKRSATIPRYDGKTRNVRRFPVYTPAALAGIAGGMPTPLPPARSPFTCVDAERMSTSNHSVSAWWKKSPGRSAPHCRSGSDSSPTESPTPSPSCRMVSPTGPLKYGNHSLRLPTRRVGTGPTPHGVRALISYSVTFHRPSRWEFNCCRTCATSSL